jgi:hypothetical protein
MGPGDWRLQVNQNPHMLLQSGVAQQVLSFNPGPNIFRVLSDEGVYVFNMSMPSPPSITGDPQFIGFRGQDFQVHGVPGTIYSLVSTATLQENARFIFLGTGECPAHLPKAECWTHAGTYLGEIGINIVTRRGQHSIRVLAGKSSEGLKVWLDSEPLDVSPKPIDLVLGTRISPETLERRMKRRENEVTLAARSGAPVLFEDGFVEGGDLSASSSELERELRASLSPRPFRSYIVSYTRNDVLEVSTPDFHFRISNSHNFLNQAVSLYNLATFVHTRSDAEGEAESSALALQNIHGVLGQTVRPLRYPNRWRYLQGDIDEYAEDHLFSGISRYACFQGNQTEVTPE